MRRFILTIALLGACGDNLEPVRDDAGVVDASPDAAIDAPTQQAVGPCLARPTDLPRPPTGALPCDLLPPGSTLTGVP
jgi:hypothetical protein